jgi:hypothetical protein
MAKEFDPVEAWQKIDAIGRTLTASPPLAIGSGLTSVKGGALRGYGSAEMAIYSLAPPTFFIQRVEQESMTVVGPPLTFTGDEITKVTFTDLGMAAEAKLKLSDGRQLKLGVVNGDLYGDDTSAELKARIDASCDSIVAWLKDPT